MVLISDLPSDLTQVATIIPYLVNVRFVHLPTQLGRGHRGSPKLAMLLVRIGPLEWFRDGLRVPGDTGRHWNTHMHPH